MDTKVGLRATHYETLGLTPTASPGQIDRAFASALSISRPRPFGGLAEVSLAYEVLRDPARRRAYDSSLGLGAPPPARRAAAHWNSAPFIGRAMTGHAPAAPSEAGHREPAVADKTTPALAAPVRPQSEPVRRPVPDLPTTSGVRAETFAVAADDRPIEWRRPAVIVAGLVAAVGLTGGLLGVQAGNDVEASQAGRGLTVALPRAKPKAGAALVQNATPPAVQPLLPEHLPIAAAPARQRSPARRPAIQPSTAVIAQAEPAESQPTTFEEAAVQSLPAAASAAATGAASASASAASLPLSNAAIARTIGRIGYRCGQVASVDAADSPGIFTVTCTSGDSYRAAPVRGRYHFRRSGG